MGIAFLASFACVQDSTVLGLVEASVRVEVLQAGAPLQAEVVYYMVIFIFRLVAFLNSKVHTKFARRHVRTIKEAMINRL